MADATVILPLAKSAMSSPAVRVVPVMLAPRTATLDCAFAAVMLTAPVPPLSNSEVPASALPPDMPVPAFTAIDVPAVSAVKLAFVVAETLIARTALTVPATTAFPVRLTSSGPPSDVSVALSVVVPVVDVRLSELPVVKRAFATDNAPFETILPLPPRTVSVSKIETGPATVVALASVVAPVASMVCNTPPASTEDNIIVLPANKPMFDVDISELVAPLMAFAA